MRKSCGLPIILTGLLLSGYVHVPTGPSVMVLPGNGKDFEQFKVDDTVCRQWALQQTGTTTEKASTDTTVTGAAVGTVLGAATGAAVGAAYGSPGTGAAVGSGLGLLGGTAVGADDAASAERTVQRRYDIAYMQCMYAKGNQVPMPRGTLLPRQRPGIPPPPPAGRPPPPPPEAD